MIFSMPAILIFIKKNCFFFVQENKNEPQLSLNCRYCYVKATKKSNHSKESKIIIYISKCAAVANALKQKLISNRFLLWE